MSALNHSKRRREAADTVRLARRVERIAARAPGLFDKGQRILEPCIRVTSALPVPRPV